MYWDGIDCFWESGVRIFSFSGSSINEFDVDEGEECDLEVIKEVY